MPEYNIVRRAARYCYLAYSLHMYQYQVPGSWLPGNSPTAQPDSPVQFYLPTNTADSMRQRDSSSAEVRIAKVRISLTVDSLRGHANSRRLLALRLLRRATFRCPRLDVGASSRQVAHD